MTFPWIGISLPTMLLAISIVGAILGFLVAYWSEVLLLRELPNWTPKARRRTRWSATLGTAFLFGLLVWLIVDRQVQYIPEVAPSEFARFCQILFHLALVTFLVGITITDLWDYAIMDQMIRVGLVVGLGGQFLSGELQIQHLWVDWNAAQEGLKGPDFPLWIDRYRHLHGLVVGLAGALAGAGITWFVRAISSAILKQETMGMGDVLLMAVIGSYLGWQPVLFVLALAPLTGLFISMTQRLLGGKSYVPYGPFLALACYLVLCSWNFLWTPLRDVFGHAPSIMGVVGGAGAAFVILLILLRLYRSIPISDAERYSAREVVTDEETQSAKGH